MTRGLSCALALLALVLIPSGAMADEPPRLRVCVSDAAVPPYLSGNPDRPGVTERLLLDSGQRLGLTIELLRWPARRCLDQLRLGQVEAGVGAPTPGNLADFDFPGQPPPDPSYRLAHTALVLVTRRDSELRWDGRQLQSGARPPQIGVRNGFRLALDQLRLLGVEASAAPAQAAQQLRMLALGRFDGVALIREEVEGNLARPEFADLVMSERPLAESDFYLAASRRLTPAQKELMQRWWELLARMRDLPAYRPVSP